MGKILIDNRTGLNYEEIGIIVDDLLEKQKGQTNYVGKWNGYELTYHQKEYKIETMVMKRYFKIFIMKDREE